MELILDEDFFLDRRIEQLAALTHEPIQTARGRIISLWHDCLILGTAIRTNEEIDEASGWFHTDRLPYAHQMAAVGLAIEGKDSQYRVWGIASQIDRQKATKGTRKRAKQTALPLPSTMPMLLGSPQADPSNQDVARLIATYVESFQKRYGPKARPDVSGKVRGLMQRLLKDYPIDRACELVQVYLQMEEPWFKTKCHDFVTFTENLSKVNVAHGTGNDPSKPQRRSIAEVVGEGSPDGLVPI